MLFNLPYFLFLFYSTVKAHYKLWKVYFKPLKSLIKTLGCLTSNY